MLPDGLLPGRSATDRFTFECPFVGMLKVIEEPARSLERSGRRQVVRTSQHLVYLFIEPSHFLASVYGQT